MHSNQLSGSIPGEIGNLSTIRALELHDNALTGTLPPEIVNLQNLQVLRIERNSLSGEWPRELGRLEKIEFVLADSNQFSGPLPPQLDSVPYRAYLSFADNELTGELPTEFSALSRLGVLDLRRNYLTGCIPWKWRIYGAFPILRVNPQRLRAGGTIELEGCSTYDAVSVTASPGEWTWRGRSAEVGEELRRRFVAVRDSIVGATLERDSLVWESVEIEAPRRGSRRRNE